MNIDELGMEEVNEQEEEEGKLRRGKGWDDGKGRNSKGYAGVALWGVLGGVQGVGEGVNASPVSIVSAPEASTDVSI